MVDSQEWIDKEELQRYRQAVQDYMQGNLNEERFQAIRLQQGVYGQRQEGVNMVRIKLPGGCISAQQLRSIAMVLADHSNEDIASVTTRQDIQLHSIPLAKTPQVLESLAYTGMTTREACGNTVRNITACPLAGVCPGEHCDVQPMVEAVSQRFLRHPLTQHLPRKFKMSFSGCESDCAQGLFHDLAVVATRRGEHFGYKVMAAGGLGHKPRPGIVVEEFIQAKDLLPVIEAVLALHHRYSDRKRRARARLKFLLERLGKETFLEKYAEELTRTREVYASDSLPAPTWVMANNSSFGITGSPRDVLEQKQVGLYVFPVGLQLGDLNKDQILGISEILELHNLQEVRVSQDQNLMLLHIPAAEVESVRCSLVKMGLDSPCAGDDVVACPGTWTCRLGITASRQICQELSGGVNDLRVRVSGCHNGCAQPYVGDIGLHGEGRRIHGKLIPHYRLHLGGDGRGGGEIGVRGPEIPAIRTPLAVQRIKQSYLETQHHDESFQQWVKRKGIEHINELLQDLMVIHENQIEQLAKDFGASQDFRVLQLGGGECMGAAQELVAANFSEAAHEREYRRVFQLAKKSDQALDCVEAIARLIGQSLLHTIGVDSFRGTLKELCSKLKMNIDNAYLVEALQSFIWEIARLRLQYDENAFQRMVDMQDAWLILAAGACKKRDPHLDLQAFLPEIPSLAKAV